MGTQSVVSDLERYMCAEFKIYSKVSGTIYVGGERYEEHTSMLTKVFGMFTWTNPLHAGVFPGVRQLEVRLTHLQCVHFLFLGSCCVMGLFPRLGAPF